MWRQSLYVSNKILSEVSPTTTLSTLLSWGVGGGGGGGSYLWARAHQNKQKKKIWVNKEEKTQTTCPPNLNLYSFFLNVMVTIMAHISTQSIIFHFFKVKKNKFKIALHVLLTTLAFGLLEEIKTYHFSFLISKRINKQKCKYTKRKVVFEHTK